MQALWPASRPALRVWTACCLSAKGRIRLFVFYLFVGGLVFSSCQTDIQTINQVTTGKGLPSETMKGAEIIYSDSGIVKMKLTGPELDRYSGEKPYIIFPKGVKVLFYNDSMKVNSQLDADYGIRYEEEGRMEAKRNVVVVNIKGEKLNTEHLIWDEGKDRIYTNEFVKVTTGDDVIYGNGLEANRDFTRWRITNVKGMINRKDQ